VNWVAGKRDSGCGDFCWAKDAKKGENKKDADEPAAAVGQLVGAAPVQQAHAWGPGKTLGGPKRFRWNLKPGERLALDNC